MPNNSTPQISEYITAHEMTIGNIILPLNRRFTAPLNQRPWAWGKKEKIQDLLDDFLQTMNRHYDSTAPNRWETRLIHSGPPHFFGTFVLYAKDRDTYEIFDGQQPITALSMLCAVLQENAYNLVHQLTGLASDTALDLFGKFRQWLLADGDNSPPRLSPDLFFSDVFNALISGCIRDEDRKVLFQGLPHEVRDHSTTLGLKRSFYQIHQWIANNVEEYSQIETLNFLRAANFVLRDRFVAVQTIITNEPYAFEVFECLNTRGVSLSEGDKVKNELFKASDQSVHERISHHWRQICEDVQGYETGEFLRRRHIALHGPCKKYDIHRKIKKIELSDHDCLSVVEGWRRDGRLVFCLERRDPGLVNERTETHLKVISNVLNVSLAVIPLLIAAKKFLPERKEAFERCASLVERFVFRQLTIMRVKTPELEGQLGEAARILNQTANLDSFQASLRSYSSDVQFENLFASYVTTRSKVQYYVLREIETELLGGGGGVVPGDHDQFRNNLEHILPKRLSGPAARTNEWQWARDDPVLHKSLVNRLGNILILESEINKGIKNYNYSIKRSGFSVNIGRRNERRYEGYCDSQLVWPRRLATGVRWDTWTHEQIELRQKKMALVARSIWGL